MRQKITTFLKRIQHTVTARFFVVFVAVCVLAVAGFVYWQDVAEFLGIRSAQAAGYQMQTGYYIGNGGSQAISGLGFTPELVVIKADTIAGLGAIFKTTAMPDGSTAYLGTPTLDDTTGLITLAEDGFLVTGANSNSQNVRFVWIAFSGSDCSAGGQFCVGAYSGDGLATKAVATGFQPDLVWVKQSTGVAPSWRSSSMAVNYAQFFAATAQDTTGAYFTTLDAAGFTVGTSNNTAGGTFYFVAFKETAGVIDVGTYTGDGKDNRSVAGVGFQPNWMFTKSTNNVAGVQSASESYGDYTSYFADTANLVNSVQLLEADGFQLGTSNTSNANRAVYHYAAFGGASAPEAQGSFNAVSGSYVGNGESQVIGNLGFEPNLVIIKASTTQAGVFRTSMMGGDTSANLDAAATTITDAITALNPTSFAIGNSATVNTSGVTYYWTAYGNAWDPRTRTGSSDFVVGAYTGSGIDLRDITRLPFQPDHVAIKQLGVSAGVWRTSEHAGDLSSFYAATAEAANYIQALNADGFEVGTAANVNSLGLVHWYFGFATGTNFAVGTYSGTGVAKTVSTPFESDQVWVKHTGATRGVLRTSSMQSSSSAPFINVAPIVNAITGIVPSGFTIGTSAEVNTAGTNNYRYAAWRDTATVGTATYRMQTGYYVGSGGTQVISGVGFAPDVVVLKADTNIGLGALMKTSAMPQTSTAYLGNATGDDTSGLITLTADGFTVAGPNSNSANIRFTWVAFGGNDCSASGTLCVGRYIGNGTSPRALTTGFQPELAIVKQTTSATANWRTSLMPNNYGQYFAATAQNTAGALFTTLNANGFSVGATNNTAAGIYHFVAFNETSGSVDVGTYGGNGIDNTPITGVGFRPDWMFAKQTGAVGAVYNLNESNGDYSSYFLDNGNLVDSVQTLETDGFQLGTNNTANAAGTTYYYAAFGGANAPTASGSFVMSSGSYTGTGNTQIMTELGFQPDLVIIKGATLQAGAFRTRIMAGNSTAFLDAPQANFADGITTLGSDSFTVGSNASVNSAGVTYYWTAFGNAWDPNTRSGAGDFHVGAYTGNAGDNFTIGRQPFTPDFAVVKRDNASGGIWRTSEHSGDQSSYFTATAEGANLIQQLSTDGFQVGSDPSVNSAGNLNWFFTFATSSTFMVGTYSGTGGIQTIDVGFQPYHLWVKQTGAVQGVLRPSALTGGGALPFVNTASVGSAITGTTGTGFTVGTAAETNSIGTDNYRYAVWQKKTRYQMHYHFRANDGDEVSATSLTGGVEDTPLAGARENQPYRLRVEVSNEGGVVADPGVLRLEFAEKSTTCAAVSGWTRVGDVGGAWDMYDSPNLTDGSDTTNISIALGGVTDENTTFLTPNGGVKDATDETASLTLLADQFVEVEYAITPTTYATDTAEYCFRVTAGDAPLSEYVIYPEASFAVHLMGTTTGTQIAEVDVPTADVYVGGAFVFYDATAVSDTHSITDLTIHESGTVDAQTGLDNIRLFYEYDTTAPYDCASESYAGTEDAYGLTDTDGFSAPDGTSSFAGSATASSTQAVCVYPVLDVTSSALSGETIALSIASTDDVGLANGDKVRFVITPLALTGATTLVDELPTLTHYHFRNDDGSEAGATSATAGLEDTPLINVPKLSPRRVRIGVSNDGTATSSGASYRLEYAPRLDTCAATASGWTDVGDVGGAWDMFDSSNLTDGSDTTNISVANGGVTDENLLFLTPNGGVRDTSSQTGVLSLEPEEFVELEYSIEALSGAGEGVTYCFRVSNAGVPLKVYDTFPEALIMADVYVEGSGMHTESIRAGAVDQYTGGVFAVRDLAASRNVTSVTLTESGTVDAQTNLNDIRVYYEMDTSTPYDCASEAYGGDEAQYGATSTAFSSADGTATFSQSIGISTTAALCLYPVLDVGVGAGNGETIILSIDDPNTDVIVSTGIASPATPVGPTGAVSIAKATLEQAHFHFRNDDGDEAGATSATGGTEDTPQTNVVAGSVQRLRLEVSNTGSTTSAPAVLTLEYAERITTCSAANGWGAVGAPGSAWSVSYSANLTAGSDTTNISESIGGVTDANTNFLADNNGVIEGSATSSSFGLPLDTLAELEWVIEANTNAVPATTYCFRVTADGDELSSYAMYPEATMRVNQDFYIQRGVTDILGGNTSVPIVAGTDYVAPSASTSAFIRITNSAQTGAGNTSGGGTQDANRVTVGILNPSDIETSVTFFRGASVNPTRIYWEIVEYIGPEGGDNEIKVRAQEPVTYNTAGTTVTTAGVSGVLADEDVVVFITGQQNPAADNTSYPAGVSTAQWNSGNDTATFSRGATGVATVVSFAIVEFTGSNWKVQRSEHTYSAGGVTQTETITDVNDLTRAFVHAQKRVGENQVDEFGHLVWLESVGQVSYQIQPAVSTPSLHTSVAWVIENTQTNGTPMQVTRSSATQASGGPEPSTYSIAIGATLSSISNGSIFMSMSAVGSNLFHPRAIMGAGITSTTNYELWISDTGSGRTYRTEIVDWPTAELTLEQNYYRWFVNNDALDPIDPWPPGATELGENTTITSLDEPPSTGDTIRLRMTVGARGASVSQGTRIFRLQYGVRETTCGAISSWQDTGDSASTTVVWRGYNATPEDGTPLSSDPPSPGDLDLSVSDRAGTYEEANPTAYNPYKILINEDMEYDWILQENGAPEQTFYCFRMIEEDGTEFAEYSYYPTLKTAGFEVVTTDWRWFDDETSLTPSVPQAATNTAPTGVGPGDVLKLRVNVAEVAGKNGSNVKFKLQYSTVSDFSVVHDVVDTDNCTAGSLWCYADGAGTEGALVDGKALFSGDTCVGGVGDGCGTHNEFSYAPDPVGEVGTTSVGTAGTTVLLQHTYVDPVFIAEAISGDTSGGGGNRPAAAIITATTTSSFTVRIQEPDSEPDTHGAETVAYVVMERGAYQLPDGRRVDVGTLDTASYYGNAVAGSSEDTCAFVQTFSNVPLVVTALQSNRNTGTPDFLTVSARLSTVDDFACAIEVPDGVATAPGSPETIGWIAIDQGTFTNNAIRIVATSTAASITGWSDTPWYTYSWPFEYFSAVPGIVSSKQTRNGTEGGWVRYGGVTDLSAQLAIDEADGGDRTHVAEVVGLFAFSEAGMFYRTGGSGIAFGANTEKEFEYTLMHKDAAVGQTYFFRLYDVGSDMAVGTSTSPDSTYPSIVSASGAVTFSIQGIESGSSTEGVVVDVTTTPTSVPFGTLGLGVDRYAAQRLTVSTNATRGYQVFAYERQDLIAGTGAVIGDVLGTNPSPLGWSDGCLITAQSCYGYHTGDNILAGGSTRFFITDTYAALTSSLAEVAYSSGPAVNESTDVVYRIRASAGQPAGQYESKVVYIVVPVF